MSWLDDALARQSASARPTSASPPLEPAAQQSRDQTAAAQVHALDGLIQLLLNEYGERAFGHTFRGKQYGTRLEHPGQRPGPRPKTVETWDWHWHLYSFARSGGGLEVHPAFDEHGTIVALRLSSQGWSIDCHPEEEAIKAALVQAYLKTRP